MAQWYVNRSGRQFGPGSLEQLQRMASTGQLQPTDMVWEEGSPQWVPASSVPQLFGSLPTLLGNPPAPVPPPAPARVAAPAITTAPASPGPAPLRVPTLDSEPAGSSGGSLLGGLPKPVLF